jgi:hypothetical protein
MITTTILAPGKAKITLDGVTQAIISGFADDIPRLRENPKIRAGKKAADTSIESLTDFRVITPTEYTKRSSVVVFELELCPAGKWTAGSLARVSIGGGGLS